MNVKVGMIKTVVKKPGLVSTQYSFVKNVMDKIIIDPDCFCKKCSKTGYIKTTETIMVDMPRGVNITMSTEGMGMNVIMELTVNLL